MNYNYPLSSLGGAATHGLSEVGGLSFQGNFDTPIFVMRRSARLQYLPA